MSLFAYHDCPNDHQSSMHLGTVPELLYRTRIEFELVLNGLERIRFSRALSSYRLLALCFGIAWAACHALDSRIRSSLRSDSPKHAL